MAANLASILSILNVNPIDLIGRVLEAAGIPIGESAEETSAAEIENLPELIERLKAITDKIDLKALLDGPEYYKQYAIEPLAFITVNNLPFLVGAIIKYVMRYQWKGGIADLDKAIHCIEVLKEQYTKHNEEQE